MFAFQARQDYRNAAQFPFQGKVALSTFGGITLTEN